MRHAFSLVELSIVLVTLGLLVGGVLAGQSLIRAAELRAVSTEHARYTSAVMAFRNKYFSLPGDFSKAIDFWTQATNCPGTAAQGSTTQATCNGNQDGMITTSGGNANELYRFWQHLANAGLIEGTYSGVAGPTDGNESLIGSNVPRSRMNNGGWTIYWFGSQASSSNLWPGEYGNVWMFGASRAGDPTSGAILKPEEAWNIDMKMDDGLPRSGIVVPYKPATAPNCADSASDTAATYALTHTGITCNLFIKNSF